MMKIILPTDKNKPTTSFFRLFADSHDKLNDDFYCIFTDSMYNVKCKNH